MSQHPAPPAPPAPRWLRPAVRVRLRSGVVCVEQRVPARVSFIMKFLIIALSGIFR